MYHFTEEQLKYDAERTEYFDSIGIKIIRFENAEVFEKTEEVLRKIRNVLKSTTPSLRDTSPKNCTGSQAGGELYLISIVFSH